MLKVVEQDEVRSSEHASKLHRYYSNCKLPQCSSQRLGLYKHYPRDLYGEPNIRFVRLVDGKNYVLNWAFGRFNLKCHRFDCHGRKRRGSE
ncbi:hypothetical protein WG66_017042, partial [Moniliophthora roreri]